MSVIIHGATHSTNFGDVLFAELFYEQCKVNNMDAEFLEMPKYGIGDFCASTVGYKKNKSFIKQLLGSDALIMMSGGYLGEDVSSLKNTIKRYLHYILPARLFEMLKKPVYFIGVGGGPLLSSFLRNSSVKMLNKAEYVSVRDEETKAYFECYGVTREIVLSTDTAQVVNLDYVKDHLKNDMVYRLEETKKYLFLHVVSKEKADVKMAKHIAPAINRFLEEHPEYDVVIGTDEVIPTEKIKETYTFQTIIENRRHVFVYNNIFQLCGLLSRADFIVTPKLHVGIVSASLNKPVISFPIHREKTGRYYKQIGEEQRSIHIDQINEAIAYEQISKYHNKPITLNNEIREKAKMNMAVIKLIDR